MTVMRGVKPGTCRYKIECKAGVNGRVGNNGVNRGGYEKMLPVTADTRRRGDFLFPLCPS